METSDEKCLDVPMAVLVNGDSYSAAEFFAAALSEREWATVVGEQTSGKGYYQVTYSLPDGSAVACPSVSISQPTVSVWKAWALHRMWWFLWTKIPQVPSTQAPSSLPMTPSFRLLSKH